MKRLAIMNIFWGYQSDFQMFSALVSLTNSKAVSGFCSSISAHPPA